MADIKDSVVLSGGPLAGEIHEGETWTAGGELQIDNYIYRRLEHDENGLTEDQAVFCGKAQ